ncbi:MAG TPA: zinc-binding dehydrogenase [Burkholderiales bacterium]|nr:zinc-binding dehydrogenase [Burkholderiales bacterium]
MKAAAFRRFGGPEVLEYIDLPTPEPRAGNVVVKVLASGVNRLEHYLREGSVLSNIPLPHVLGSDAAGEVAAVGAGVTQFKPGDRVVPMPGYPLDAKDDGFAPLSAAPSYAIGGIVRWGTYAEYVEVPAKWVLRDETGLKPEQLATLPMVLVTAVRSVKVVGGVKAGDRVLVHAGASGTGTMNIQVARALGAHVATTVQGEQQAKLASALGAELVIDVQSRDFVKDVRDWTDGRGVDVAIDNLGGDILQKSIDATRVSGTIVAMGFVAGVEVRFHIRNFFFTHKRLLGTLMGDVADFRWGLQQIRAGKIRPLLDRALPLAEAAEAHRLIAANAVNGNLVLKP